MTQKSSNTLGKKYFKIKTWLNSKKKNFLYAYTVKLMTVFIDIKDYELYYYHAIQRKNVVRKQLETII